MGTLAVKIAHEAQIDRLVAQRQVISIPELRSPLANNNQAHLHEEIWFDMYRAGKKVAKDIAEGLAGRVLTQAQIEHVLTTDGRGAVIAACYIANPLTAEQQARVVESKGFTKTVAEGLYTKKWATAETRAAAARAAGGPTLMGWIALTTEDELSVEDAIELLSTARDWYPAPKGYGSRTTLKDLATQVLNMRPETLPAAFAAGQYPEFRTAAAGCRHLTNVDHQWQVAGINPDGTTEAPAFEATKDTMFRLMALVNNPVCDMKVVETVATVADRHQHVEKARDLAISCRDRLTRTLSRPTLNGRYDELEILELIDWIVTRSKPKTEERSDSYSYSKWGSDTRINYGKPWDLVVVAHNPRLTAEMAATVHRGLGIASEKLPEQVLDAAYAALIVNHPELAPTDEAGTRNGEPRPAPTSAPQRSAEEEAAFVERVLDWPARNIGSNLATAWPIVDAALGDDEARWQTFFGMVDNDHGTIRELLEFCEIL